MQDSGSCQRYADTHYLGRVWIPLRRSPCLALLPRLAGQTKASFPRGRLLPLLALALPRICSSIRRLILQSGSRSGGTWTRFGNGEARSSVAEVDLQVV